MSYMVLIIYCNINMNIQELFKKIKYLGDSIPQELFVAFIIILVGFGSFGLGRISSDGVKRDGVKIVMPNINTGANTQTATLNMVTGESVAIYESGEVVASKSGSKYHFPWCSGAKRIKEENKIKFPSIKDARTAGYEPAKNCKGLR